MRHQNLRKNLPGKRAFHIFFLLIIFIAITAFRSQETSPSTVFRDSFESYVNTYQLQKAYATWEDGARIEVVLEEDTVDGSGNAMQVKVLGPNPHDGQKTGSLFHSLPLFSRNWSGAEGISFWLGNPSEDALWLTFNFKEAYNEYWSVNSGSSFFLMGADETYSQSECLYGNLVIPANFTGRVIIPLESFSVPDWNTARGDRKLQTGAVESYAIGVTLNEDYPRTFYVDTFEVLADGNLPRALRGETVIRIPETGEHRESYTLDDSKAVTGSDYLWEIQSTLNPGVSIDQDGVLTIPADSQDETISVKFSMGNQTVNLPVKLVLGENTEARSGVTEAVEEVPVQILEKSDYEQFSEDFEKWALENRPLFVTISVFLVVVVIYMLSAFQNRLK